MASRCIPMYPAVSCCIPLYPAVSCHTPPYPPLAPHIWRPDIIKNILQSTDRQGRRTTTREARESNPSKERKYRTAGGRNCSVGIPFPKSLKRPKRGSRHYHRHAAKYTAIIYRCVVCVVCSVHCTPGVVAVWPWGMPCNPLGRGGQPSNIPHGGIQYTFASNGNTPLEIRYAGT